jgi:hypothetical protein
MGFFSRRKQSESALSQAVEPLSSQEGTGDIGEPIAGISDPLANPAGASAMSALGGWSPNFDPNDPEAAMKAAQEAFANSPLGSGPLSHLPMAKQIQEQMEMAAKQVQSAEAYAAANPPPAGTMPGAPAAGAGQAPTTGPAGFEQFTAAMAGMAAAGQSAAGTADPIAQLERLAALRASGALSEEEFAEQKRKVLGEG